MAVAEQIDNDTAADAADDGAEKLPFIQTPMGRNFLRAAGAAAIVAILLGLWLWNKPPDYGVLFSNFTDRDGGAITAELDKLNVKHKFSENGSAILVPTEQVHDIRLKLAAQGLPKGGNVGFELMENQKLGVSQFLEQVNYQRALEGELARSIQSLAAIENARVHLALPKPSVFVRDQQKPTASVIVTLHPNRQLDPAQTAAIVHLVASSVPELLPANVSVIDQAGNLISDQNKNGNGLNAKNMDETQLKYVKDMQLQVIKQVESIIIPIVGEGNVRAEATADVDFAQIEQAAETYKPNSPPAASAIRSQQSSETNGNNGSTNPGGIPGALSNQPPGTATAPLTQTAGSPTGTAPAPGTPPGAAATSTANGPNHKESTTNYEVDKTVRYEQRGMGGLRRMTVAVVVNYKRIVGKDGKVTIKAYTPEEMAKINDLVKQAMGFNQDRGDAVSVANSPFDGVDKPFEPPPEWWRDPANLPMAKDLAKFLITALILLYIVLRIVKPMMRPVFKKIDEINAPEPEPEEPEEVVEEGPDEALIAEEELRKMEENTVRSYRENLAMAKKLATEDPRIVANVIKEWIGAND
ncbi:flagellar basal-body MS-ring/collar protein FliF [Duganella sp. S19_KUP01_CR8]|uniref:flagellar basal-body MS-ring/collar protein FliF n=1 Tax=Duganella sp. S19_KUP01_CR8 TaxID=3025502 RepID=UPI002FCD8F48